METSLVHKIIEFDISKKAALCTQIDWKGSVPRKDFPMMLVDEIGGIIGTIGGGALEHSAINLANSVIQNKSPVLKQFNLTNQDVTKDGSICGGVTTILIEPFTVDIQNKLAKAIEDESLLLLKVSVDGDEINRHLITTQVFGQPKEVQAAIRNSNKTKISMSLKIDDDYYLLQNFYKKPFLHIFGAGHVGQAVAEMANFIGLHTKIYDERDDLNNFERFPFADDIIVERISNIIKKSKIEAIDYVMVATRGHQHDFKLMQWLLGLELSYISLVSSDKKWQLLSEALVKDDIPKNKINKVHAPVGLDIGSETVPEIAISIIAEIINHYRKQNKSDISLSKK